MRGRAVWTLLSGASVLLVTALAQAQCTMDTDCKGARVCEAGKCIAPLPPAPPAPPGSEAAATTAAEPGAAGASTPALGAGQPPGQGAPAVELQVQPAPSSAAPVGATTPLERDEPQTRRRSRGTMVAGIIMVSVAPVAVLGALAAKNSQEKCDTALERDYPDHRLPPSERYRVDDCNSYAVPLYVLGIGGALLAAVGVPMIIYGAKSVPNGPPTATLRVVPWANPEAGGLRLRLEL